MSDETMKLLAEYSNMIGRFGPDCETAKRMRATYSDNKEFLRLADALDCIKRHLGGKGMEPGYRPEDRHDKRQLKIHWTCLIRTHSHESEEKARQCIAHVEKLLGEYPGPNG